MDTEADPLANLSPEQVNTLFSFSDITQIEETNLCRSILAQNNWNLDVAVENFINNRTGDSVNHSSEEQQPQQSHPSTREISGTRPAPAAGLFDFITSPLRWLFQTTPISLSPDQDTIQFVDKFHQEYGTSGSGGGELVMERSSYARAVQKAHRESKFLLVYLHSPLHDDTSRFCTQVLHSDQVLRLVNGSRNTDTDTEDDHPSSGRNQEHASGSDLVAWAGQVWDPEAYNLSVDLHAASFPFVALLVCQSDRSVRVLDRIHGFIDHINLTERLQNSMTATRVELDRIRNEQVARTYEANLRVDQDREYQEAMERDRQLQQEAQRLREERERIEEEEAMQRELDEAMALSQQLSRETALAKKRAVMQRATPTGPDSALIRFQLPQGVKVSHTFWKTDPVGCLYDFLSVHFADNDIAIENFMVSTNFPKKDLTDRGMTVAEAGLHPRGALFVHNLDT